MVDRPSFPNAVASTPQSTPLPESHASMPWRQWMNNSRLRALIALLAMIIVAIPSLNLVFPRNVMPAQAAVRLFSAERAMVHVPVIAREPHASGTPAQEKVRDYLLQTLSALGLEVQLQQSSGADNVVARLSGTASTGAIVILSHYDSVAGSPGAADNASGVAVLLEVARALKARAGYGNDLIFLFDDSEELPDAFTGSKAFVREHPWMKTVRVAISLDSAIAGPTSIVEIGQDNGWVVNMLAKAYTGGAWTSTSGGGGYDSTPFRNAGIMAVAMEDNYPFREKHTAADLPAIVQAHSVQQMGEQVVAIVEAMGSADLSQTRGPQETFFIVPLFGFFHYPVSRALPFAIMALILFILEIGSAWRLHIIHGRGLAIALGSILAATAVSAILITLIQPILPNLFGWETQLWPDWPEIIPPNGSIAFAGFGILVFTVNLVIYRLARRRVQPAEYAMAALIPFALFALVFGLALPSAAYLFTWPVAISAIVWLVAIFVARRRPGVIELALSLAAWQAIVFILPYIPGIIMSDGTKSLNILGAIFALIIAICAPAADSLVMPFNRRTADKPAKD